MDLQSEKVSSPEAVNSGVIEQKGNKNLPIIVFVSVAVALAGGVLLVNATQSQSRRPDTIIPTVLSTPEETEVPEDTATATPSETATPTSIPTVTVTEKPSAGTKATISGKLSYPAGYIPPMKVCAVDTTTKRETCVNTKENAETFTIAVTAGKYVVYAGPVDTPTWKLYYTNCDTYDNQESPEYYKACTDDPAYGGKDEWQNEGFICYNDARCKLAYTPVIVIVKSAEKKVIKKLMYGWYLPCSGTNGPCDESSPDEWKFYLPY